jgi:hypothetical protein
MNSIIVFFAACFAVSTASLDNVIEKSIDGMLINSLKGAIRSNGYNGYNDIPHKYNVKPIKMIATGLPNQNFGTDNQNYKRDKLMSMMIPTSMSMGGSYPPMNPFMSRFQELQQRPRGPKNINLNLKVSPPSDSNGEVEVQATRVRTFDAEKESSGEVNASWNTEFKEVFLSGLRNETRVKTFKNSGKIHAVLGSEKEKHIKGIGSTKIDSRKKVNSVFSKRNLFEQKTPEKQQVFPAFAMNSEPQPLPIPMRPLVDPMPNPDSDHFPLPHMQRMHPEMMKKMQRLIQMQRPMNNAMVPMTV